MRPIFVFGSNLAGIHGAGAAHEAYMNWAAEWGTGWGLTGDSFAIPTKDAELKTLPLSEIEPYVVFFTKFARLSREMYFFVTPVGCGLAGYDHLDVAPLFRDAAALPNVGLCTRWRDILCLNDLKRKTPA